MEAALQQLSSSSCEPVDMAGNSELSSDSDVLMKDPFLDYINEVLMEEGMEDATCLQHAADASYRAIMNGFYEIIGEHLPSELSADSTSRYEDNSDLHAVYQINTWYMDGIDGQHGQASSQHKDGVTSLTSKLGFPRVCMPANVNTHREIVDMVLSSRGDVAVVDGLMNHTSFSGKEQGNGPFNFPSEAEDTASKLNDIDVSFEDLKLKDDYTSLYVDEPSSAGSSTKAAMAGKGGSRKSGNKRTSNCCVDLRELLVSCAQAVAVGHTKKANEILQELRQVHGVSAKGSGLQRTAHYFSEALLARMRGIGGHQFQAISHNMPSAATILKASKLGFEVAPFSKIMHFFANQSILKAAEGASRLHIVDYGLMYGMQWPCLMNALADRKGGPPVLVITGIEFPQAGNNPAQRIEESGRRLAAYARIYNVPFEYHAIATSKWEDLDTASLHLHEEEVLIVNCMMRLRQLADESVVMGLQTSTWPCRLADESVDMALQSSPREKLLNRMRSLNPHFLLFGDVNAAYNLPFFVSRFREALYFFSSAFDILDTLWGERPERLVMERCCFYRDIMNIVACEGEERVERPETYKQWQVRIKRAGFEQLPIPPTILSRSRSHLKQHYHKDFMVHDDANRWMLLDWKGRTTLALSVWKPSHV